LKTAGLRILLGPSLFADADIAPLEKLRAAGCDVIKNPHGRKLTKDELMALLSGVQGLIAGLETIDEEVMRKSELKVISRCGSGLSNVDMDAAIRLGIKVCYTPDAPTIAVAELTLGSMLNLLRMTSFMDREMHEGRWTKKIGTQLSGKVVGIVGLGRIGRKVASLLSPFHVRVVAADPHLSENVPGMEIIPLEKLLAEADVITLHASGEQQIIGGHEIGLMKKGVYIINAARGGLIDETSLSNAIESGKIAGAWLDTFDHEPYDGPLTKYPQVVLTPHVGSYTRECRMEMEMAAVENMLAACKDL
jgi:D-3-phosphoglycerate dehydrogenase